MVSFTPAGAVYDAWGGCWGCAHMGRRSRAPPPVWVSYIYWSENKETVSYKELELSMGPFRQFIWDQVQHC